MTFALNLLAGLVFVVLVSMGSGPAIALFDRFNQLRGPVTRLEKVALGLDMALVSFVMWRIFA